MDPAAILVADLALDDQRRRYRRMATAGRALAIDEVRQLKLASLWLS